VGQVFGVFVPALVEDLVGDVGRFLEEFAVFEEFCLPVAEEEVEAEGVEELLGQEFLLDVVEGGAETLYRTHKVVLQTSFSQ